MDDPLFRFRIHIPDEYGTVAQYYLTESGKQKVVCLVQVIGSPAMEADSNLAKILQIYLRNAEIRLLCWESAEGPIALNQMQLSSVISKVLAHYQSPKHLFLQTFKATKSPIKAFQSARSTIKMFGVDNMRMHSEMTKVQGKALSSWPKYRPVFDTLKEILHDAIAGISKPEVKDLVFLEEAWENSTLGLAELSPRLLDLADSANISLPLDVQKCLMANIRGTQFQPEAVEAERDELLARVQRYAKHGSTIQEDMVPQLLSEALEDATGSPSEQLIKARRRVREVADHLAMPALDVTRRQFITQPNTTPLGGFNPLSQSIVQSVMYLGEVFDLARALGIDLSPYCNLARYAEQMNLLSSIAGTDFVIKMAERINLAFCHLESNLVSTSQERALLAARRRLDLLERLGQIVLSPERYDMLMVDIDECSLEKVIDVLASRGKKINNKLRAKALEFDKERDYFCTFYDRARRRASAMAEGTLNLMKEHKVDVATLICLGFHIPTVCSVLVGNQVSYTVIHPRFTL
jgi:hypothetical protein